MRSILTIRVSFILVTSFLLNSCGYELRENSRSLKNFTVVFDGKESQLNRDLQENLISRNNDLVTESPKADIKIKILNHSIDEFVGATGYGARTTQVRLDYRLEYKIIKNDEDFDTHTYTDSAFVDFNNSDLLAFREEVKAAKDIFIAKGVKNIDFIFSAKYHESY